MIPSPEIKELTILDYWQIVLKRIWLVVVCVGVSTGLIAYKEFSTPKVYETAATVFIKTEMPMVVNQNVVVREDRTIKQTQLLLLQSRSLADRVIKRLDLLNDPEFMQEQDPTRKLLKSVEVKEIKEAGKEASKQESNIIAITVTGGDPIKITNIANTWVKEFIAADLERRTMVTEEGIGWLKDQAADTLAKLQEAEQKLSGFIKDNRIVTIPNLGEDKQALIDQLKEQKVQLEGQLVEALKVYKEKHPTVLALQNQIMSVGKQYEEEKDKLYTLQDKALQYNLLKRDLENFKTLYDTFRTRMQEMDISHELISPNVQTVDDAMPPSKPIRPTPERTIPMTALAGLVIGIGICYFLEYTDSSLKSSEDVEFYTKMPFLGYIPSGDDESKDRLKIDLISQLKPFSRVAEAVRNVRVSLLFASPADKPIRSLVVTSSIPEEGKSFVCINLALAFAGAKEDTLLIDADMRKGRIAEAFGVENSNGLTSVLTGMCSWEDALIKTSVPNLTLLTRGMVAPNPTELLDSEKLTEIFHQMGARFKRLIIDSPPVLSVADTLVIGDKCDGLIFVVRAHKTPLNHVVEAKKVIGQKVKVIGAILNGVSLKKDRYHYYHYYHHYGAAEK